MGSVLDQRVSIRSLLRLSSAMLAAVVAMLVGASVWHADAAPGDDDATYVPWPGCRLTDTRPGSQIGPRGEKLGANEVMTVEVYGDRGGCTGDLAIPNDAVGLATNVTVVDPTAQSNIRVYRGDLLEPPLLSNLNVTPGAPPTPNKVDTQLAPDGTIKVYNFKGSVNVVIDVVGYYTAQSLLELAGQTGPPGPQGPQGPVGPSGITPPPGALTPTQIVEGVVLTCESVSADGRGCEGARVNGLSLTLDMPTREVLCDATVGVASATGKFTVQDEQAYELADGAWTLISADRVLVSFLCDP